MRSPIQGFIKMACEAIWETLIPRYSHAYDLRVIREMRPEIEQLALDFELIHTLSSTEIIPSPPPGFPASQGVIQNIVYYLIHFLDKKKFTFDCEISPSDNFRWLFASSELANSLNCSVEILDYLLPMMVTLLEYEDLVGIDEKVRGHLNLTGLVESVDLRNFHPESIKILSEMLNTNSTWYLKAFLIIAQSLSITEEKQITWLGQVKNLEDWQKFISSPLIELMALLYS